MVLNYGLFKIESYMKNRMFKYLLSKQDIECQYDMKFIYRLFKNEEFMLFEI